MAGTVAILLALGVGALVGLSRRVTLVASVAIGGVLAVALWLLTDPLASTDGTIVFSSAALLYVAATNIVEQLRPTPQ